jgi:hypothetical protein
VQRGPSHLGHDTPPLATDQASSTFIPAPPFKKKKQEDRNKKTNTTPTEAAAIWSRHAVKDNKTKTKQTKKKLVQQTRPWRACATSGLV